MNDKDISREIKGLYTRIDKLHSSNRDLEIEVDRLKSELEQAARKNQFQSETIIALQDKYGERNRRVTALALDIMKLQKIIDGLQNQRDVSQIRENSPAETIKKCISEEFQKDIFIGLLQEIASLKGQIEAFKYCLRKSNCWEESE